MDRARSLSSIVPTTANETARTVDVVIATEAPVMMMDFSRWELVDEILLMSGLRMSEIRQGKLPLLDTHQRGTAKNVLGSTTNLRIEGDKLVGTRNYSEVSAPEFRKTIEGHLDQASVGYRVFACTYIEPGQTAIVNGKTFSAPANRALKIATDWLAVEDSLCPIGADPASGVRSMFSFEQKPTPTSTQEKRIMNKYLEFLTRHGYTGTTDDQARAYFAANPELMDKYAAEQVAKATAPAPVTPEAARAAGAADERARQDGIRALCVKFGCEDQIAACIADGRSVDKTQTHVSEIMLARQQAAQPGNVGTVTVVVAEADKVRAAMSDALSLRAGHKIEKPAPGADELRGFTMMEMGREVLRRNGGNARGTPQEIAQRALSTSDFPFALANTANKSMNVAFATAEETFKEWCGSGEVSDFKDQTLINLSETDNLDQIAEGESYKYSSRTEAKEAFRVYKYGKLFALTWESIVNDDWGVLTDIPAMHGQACSRLEGDVAYAVLTANANMGDGAPLFHGTHGNYSAAAAAISAVTLATGIKSMKLQKDAGGKRRLNIRPVFVLAPVTVEGAAESYFGSIYLNATMQANPYAGSYFKRIYDARLDDASVANWYLAGPKGQTVNVYRMRGNTAPYLESKQGFEVDGLTFKVRHVVGAKAVSWKALWYNAA
jgi:hypothetical protein